MRPIALLLLLMACSGRTDEGAGDPGGATPSVERAVADVEAAKADAARPPPPPEASPAG